MVPNASKLTDGIITSNTTTIAIHKVSDKCSVNMPRPPASPRTISLPHHSAGGSIPSVVQSASAGRRTSAETPNMVHSLPRKLKHEPAGTITLESLGDSIQTLGRGRPHLPLPSILVSSTSGSGRSSAEPTSSSSRRSSNVSEFRLSSALNALDLDNIDLRNIDPVLASKILNEIRNGADVGPLLEKLKIDNNINTNAKSIDEKTKNKEGQKMVTFEDETKPGTEEQILKADDVFM